MEHKHNYVVVRNLGEVCLLKCSECNKEFFLADGYIHERSKGVSEGMLW